jgi:uncharacterized protein YceK
MIKKVLLVMLVSVFLTGCGAVKQNMANYEAERRAAEFQMLDAKQKVEEITCKGREKCDLLFRIASDALIETSDMKVQNTSQNYISTFNPTQPGRIGISARKLLVSGDTEKVVFSATCKDSYSSFEIICNKGMYIVYTTYANKLVDNGFVLK